MRFKDDSVNPTGLRPELLFAIMVARDVYLNRGYELVITSLNDAAHSTTSLHYSGAAVDFRTTVINPNEDWDSVARQIKRRLGKHYDVINEHNHIHLEFQPRNPYA
ncbi:MAG: hypothetical protein OQK78_12350 [Gammaproteobacteria bacterium]|nr:hypothetical protein [Gammaproteobacteria bacterium]MCW8983140.1 hypothetical protein [Gammaproteobacteria bacterium]